MNKTEQETPSPLLKKLVSNIDRNLADSNLVDIAVWKDDLVDKIRGKLDTRAEKKEKEAWEKQVHKMSTDELSAEADRVFGDVINGKKYNDLSYLTQRPPYNSTYEVRGSFDDDYGIIDKNFFDENGDLSADGKVALAFIYNPEADTAPDSREGNKIDVRNAIRERLLYKFDEPRIHGQDLAHGAALDEDPFREQQIAAGSEREKQKFGKLARKAGEKAIEMAKQ